MYYCSNDSNIFTYYQIIDHCFPLIYHHTSLWKLIIYFYLIFYFVHILCINIISFDSHKNTIPYFHYFHCFFLVHPILFNWYTIYGSWFVVIFWFRCVKDDLPFFIFLFLKNRINLLVVSIDLRFAWVIVYDSY